VRYVARYPLTERAIERLPAPERKVYGLIWRNKSGATRALLLNALKATKATGRVDGALRRLRLKKLIRVEAVSGSE
jgi:hypothetical protein